MIDNTDTLYQRRKRYIHLTSADVSVTVREGLTHLHHIVINDNGAAGSILSVYADSGFSNIINSLILGTLGMGDGMLIYDLELPDGLAIDVSGSSGMDFTIVYS